MNNFSRSLGQGFLDSEVCFPHRPAIDVGHEVTYEELAKTARAIAATIQHGESQVPLTAVFAHRSGTAYAAILGALLAGNGYVPLNRTFPIARTKFMLDKAGCESVVIDASSESQLPEVLAGCERSLLLIFPDRTDVDDLVVAYPNHQVVGQNELLPETEWRSPATSPDSIAYLLFTSGSTGEPKGVMVSHRNACHYVNYVTERYSVTSKDRLSQNFDLTFDLSVHDMFVAWQSGACVCCPSVKQTIKPANFIRNARLSLWFSVPSTAIFMRRLGELEPDAYPNLRVSLFCGEALPSEIARRWALAAPNSIVENLYGPTELTIACSGYRWSDSGEKEGNNGLVSIGRPFDGMDAVVVDDELRRVRDGEAGELLMTGPQLSMGYWQDEPRTRRAFVSLRDREVIYYRTGDRVRKTSDGLLEFLGRLDGQVKVLGHRVELGEIEAVLREVTGVAGVVALGWPVMESVAEGIEAFLEAEHCDTGAVLKQLKLKLPAYMIPRNIRLLSDFPRNANGKFDRNALAMMLEQSSHAPPSP